MTGTESTTHPAPAAAAVTPPYRPRRPSRCRTAARARRTDRPCNCSTGRTLSHQLCLWLAAVLDVSFSCRNLPTQLSKHSKP